MMGGVKGRPPAHKGKKQPCGLCGELGHKRVTCPRRRVEAAPVAEPEDRAFPGTEAPPAADPSMVAGEDPTPSEAPPSAEATPEAKASFAAMLASVFRAWGSALERAGVPPPPVEMHEMCAVAWAECAAAFGWLSGTENRWVLLGSATILTGSAYGYPTYVVFQRRKRETERRLSIPPVVVDVPQSAVI